MSGHNDEPLPPPGVHTLGTSAWRHHDLRELRTPSPESHHLPYGDASSHDPLVSRTSVSLSDEHPRESTIPVASQPLVDDSSAVGEGKTPPELTPSRNTVVSWTLEILALSLSAASIIAIIAILIRENNQAVTAWKFVLTLNTVVATLATVARTSLALAISSCIGQQKWGWLRKRSDNICAFERFDEASRGPWGGTRLFIWLRFRHWAALGAIVTVGTVAFDPFFQAVISSYGKLINIPQNASATIGQALRVDGGDIIAYVGGPLANSPSGNMVSFVAAESRPDFGVISALYNGFYNTSEENNVKFDCTTGNCTWPTFVSAAVCSSCEDVSDQISFDTRYGERQEGSNVRSSTNIVRGGNYSVFSLSYSEIRNWNGLSKRDRENYWQCVSGVSCSPQTLMTVNTTYVPQETVKFKSLQTMLMAFIILRAPDDWLNSKVEWENVQPVATECAMYFCANAYQAKSENSVLREDTIGSWAIRDPSSHKFDMAERTLIQNETKEERWIEEQGFNLYSPNYLPRQDLRLLIPREQSKSFPSNMARQVNVSNALIRSTISYLEEYTSRDWLKKYGNDTRVSPIVFPDFDSPPVIDALWNSTNLTATFENVAKTLTNQIRNTSPNQHHGELQKWTIHVRVAWPYLAFPITMLMIGITYVILVIVESTRLRLPVWKERALPTLLYGFDDETQRLLRDSHLLEQSEKKMKIRFGHDEKDGRLGLFIQ